jgi:hypothetical protein
MARIYGSGGAGLTLMPMMTTGTRWSNTSNAWEFGVVHHRSLGLVKPIVWIGKGLLPDVKPSTAAISLAEKHGRRERCKK